MLSCLLGFIFSGNANFVTVLDHAWRCGDRFFAFKYYQKYQNNMAHFSERTSFGGVKTLSALCMIRLKTYCFFLAEGQRSFWTRQECGSKLCALARTFCSVQVLCYRCVTWYQT